MIARISIVSLGLSLLAVPMALAQVPVPYPLNVKPSTPQGTLTGVPVLPPASKAPPAMPSAVSPYTLTWSAPAAPVKPQTRVFDVADLVHTPVAIPGAAAPENTKAAHAHALMKTIVALTKPESWERGGGTGKIEFIAASDCLCVTNRPDALAEVEKLLAGLRRMQGSQVLLEVQFMTAPAGFGAKAGWPTVDVKGKVEPKLCAPDELKKAVVQMKGDSRVSVLSRPQLALTDGQSGMFQVLQLVEVPKAPGDSVQTAGASGTEIGIKFDCTPTVSVDGKTIALKLNTLYSALNNGGGISTIQNRSRVSLPCGNSAIVHVGTMTVEERIETRIPALSKIPYLDRLFRTVGVGTVEKDVYQVVTAHIIKDEPSVKAVLYGECIAAPCCKPVEVPQQVFRHRIGWFGGQ